MTNPLYIFAEITPKPVHFNEARDAISGIIDRTRAEEGCHKFELFTAPDENKLYLFEKWENKAALNQHYAMPYTSAVFDAYQEWLAEEPRIASMHHVA